MPDLSHDERLELVMTSGVTLNGRPAKIVGVNRDYPLIMDRETGLSAEWSWAAVQRVVRDKGGAFTS